MRTPRKPLVLAVLALVLGAGVGVAIPASAAPPGVVPSTVDLTLTPGASTTVTKVVTTPAVPYNPDVVFLADTTGSMTAAINNVRSNIGTLVGNILSVQPSAQFGVAEFKDIKDTIPFRVNQQLTTSLSAVQAGTTMWAAAGGGDFPEDQINALYRIATGDIAFRSDSTRVIALFGDAPSHDPSNGHTLADTIAALQSAGIRVIAVNASGLDAKGQATALVNATGGTLLNNVSSTAVPQAILDGIRAIKVPVAPRVTSCPAEISVGTSPTAATVTSGSAATFTETIAVSPSAAPGVYTCQVDYLVGGVSQGFVQTTTIRVLGLSINDVTVNEPGTGTGNAVFTVSLSAASTGTVTVDYATVLGTATAADLTPVSGTLTFAPGDTSKTISVPILSDTLDEPTETFQVVLSNATGASILRATGTGTIIDGDRDGSFTCSATAAKLLLLTIAAANPQNDPCVEAAPTLINASMPSGTLTVLTDDVTATTDLTPNDQQAYPAPGDGLRSSATVAGATISLLGVANIQVGAITSSAAYTCTANPDGTVTPVFSASSNVASLKVNGLGVTVGSGTLVIPLVVGQLRINATVSDGSGGFIRQAFALDTVVGTVVLGESRVGLKGTTLHPTGNPCTR
ncbi:Calx-beta domain-containing protein [Actinokineospora enzanensis]|uniref:Calx-beta domain-containing protein n=1 Tax=Actinokineospora enzanensis TaxID=155975 RepID=UPI000687AB4E|nr:Calx-beta domain-containing protein [Actinokineospora enzanensis]